MNLKSKHAIAIKNFLDVISYKEWASEVTEVVADVPRSGLGQDGKCFQLGTINFKTLADSINYLEIPVPEVTEDPQLDGKRKEIASLILTISTPVLN